MSFLQDHTYRLRSLELSDLDFLYEIENDTALWSVSNTHEPYSRYQLKRFIEENAHSVVMDGQVRFVIERVADKKPVGFMDLTDFDIINSRAQVGVFVLAEYRKSGVATAALKILEHYVRNVLFLNQLTAEVPVINEASLKLFCNSGFSKSCLMKEWLRRENGYVDVWLLQKKM